MPTLRDVVAHLHDIPVADEFMPGPTIYARRPWTPWSDAMVLEGDDVPAGTATESGYDYLLEVDIAREVVEVWSEWRHGTAPTADEAALAVIYYRTQDAFQPPQ